jgi:hypothetical protein
VYARWCERSTGILRQGFDPRLAAALLGLVSVGVLFSQPAADPVATARKALDLLLAQNYPEFATLAAPQLKTNMNERLSASWAAQIKAWGAVEKIGEPVVEEMGPTKVVTFPVSFADKNIKARFAVNPSGQVSVMYLMPGEACGRARLQQAGFVYGARRDLRRGRMEAAGDAGRAQRRRSVSRRAAGAGFRAEGPRRFAFCPQAVP